MPGAEAADKNEMGRHTNRQGERSIRGSGPNKAASWGDNTRGNGWNNGGGRAEGLMAGLIEIEVRLDAFIEQAEWS